MTSEQGIEWDRTPASYHVRVQEVSEGPLSKVLTIEDMQIVCFVKRTPSAFAAHPADFQIKDLEVRMSRLHQSCLFHILKRANAVR